MFAALAVVAWNEFRGRRQLLEFNPAGATTLGWNQLGLLGMIVVYCLWALYSNLWGGGSIEAQLRANPQLASTIGSVQGFDAMFRTIVVALYGIGDRAQRPLPRRERTLLLLPPQVR